MKILKSMLAMRIDCSGGKMSSHAAMPKQSGMWRVVYVLVGKYISLKQPTDSVPA